MADVTPTRLTSGLVAKLNAEDWGWKRWIVYFQLFCGGGFREVWAPTAEQAGWLVENHQVIFGVTRPEFSPGRARVTSVRNR